MFQLPTPGKQTTLLPVIVILHSGFHMFGSSALLGPHYLVDEDVVVITFNFRLGPFGFLSTEDGNASGNMGLRDQSLALKWVRDNVHKFSGDFERVTLMGQGTGSTDTFLHLFNPLSKGLFQRAVISSGSINTCTFANSGIKEANKLGNQVGCPTNSSKDLVACLKGK